MDITTIAPPAKRFKVKVSFPKMIDATAVTTAENGMIIATVVGLICFMEFVLIIQHNPAPITTYTIVKMTCSGLKENCIFSIGTGMPDAEETVMKFRVKANINDTMMPTKDCTAR